MNINKRAALFLMIVNIIYTIYGIGRFFYFRYIAVPDTGFRAARQLSIHSVWTIIPMILNFILFAGLLWVLITFKEKRWLRIVMMLLLGVKIIGVVGLDIFGIGLILSRQQLFYIVIFFSFYLLNILLFLLLFVRNKAIRVYFRWFVATTLIANLSLRFGGRLYDDFGINWLFVYQDLLFQLCFLVTLVLYIEVYNLSKQNVLPGTSEAV